MAGEEKTVTVRMMMVSGKSATFQIPFTSTVSQITERLMEDWPAEWEEERVPCQSMLKLIYHGRFLHSSVSLQSLGLNPGQTTTMHIVTRESLPQPDPKDDLTKRKRRSCCRCCLS